MTNRANNDWVTVLLHSIHSILSDRTNPPSARKVSFSVVCALQFSHARYFLKVLLLASYVRGSSRCSGETATTTHNYCSLCGEVVAAATKSAAAAGLIPRRISFRSLSVVCSVDVPMQMPGKPSAKHGGPSAKHEGPSAKHERHEGSSAKHEGRVRSALSGLTSFASS